MLAVCAATLLSAAMAHASTRPPLHKLHISFDLDQAVMQGTSVLEIPAGGEAIYHTPGLIITGIRINDQEVELNDRDQAYFADPDHELTLAASPLPRTVKLTYKLDLSGAGNSPVGDMITPEGISLTNLWHPFLHQDQIFELTAEIPPDFEAISEAEEISVTENDGNKSVTFSFKHPLAGINFIAAPFIVEKTAFGDNRELYTYFFAEDRELAAEYRRKTLEYLERYEKLLGPFPYKRFSVVENRLPTGYSMPTFTVLGQSVIRLPFITETSLGHETLHQWFGNSVRTAPGGGNWAEGLATLLADAQYRQEAGEGADFRKSQLIKYHSYVHPDNEITLENFIGARSHLIRGQEALRAVGYTRAAMLFHMLRNRIGEEKFIEGLRDFYRRFKHRTADWQSLIDSFELATGSSLADFFGQWLTRADLPILQIKDFSLDQQEGRPIMRFSLHQANEADPPYRLEVPLTVITDHETLTRTIMTEARDTAVEIPLTANPRELIIDADYDLMRRLADSEYPHVWSRFAGAKAKLAVVDPNQDREVFAPLLALLEGMGCKVVPAEEVTIKELGEAAVIFLGLSSSASRNLFAMPDHPGTGVTVEIRPNPLNPSLSAVLVSASDREEVFHAARKINHYGKYSYLHFEQGRAVAKRINQTQEGQRFTIDPPPGGIKIDHNLNFDEIVAQLAESRVVYLGESHTRYEDHLLQIRVIRAMYHQNPELAVGMEMFSRADQQALDSYIIDQTIDEEEFLRQSGYMTKWGFDYRFYQPIINFARLNRIPVIALNQDKAIVSKVYRETGLAGLAAEEAAAIPEDLDISMPGYRRRISSVFRMHNGHDNQAEQLNRFLHAQSLWDETMAESVADYLAGNPGRRMAVIAGRGHVDKKNAIPPRVARRLEVKQTVILNVEQSEVAAETADYLVFSPPAKLPGAAMMGIVLKEAEGRVLVDKLSPHGMAGKSGIRPGDIILALDTRPVADIEELKIIMFYKKRGENVLVKVKRERRFWPDSELEIEVPL
ncbi:MAG: ChaN family lipoprotein [Desulfurivibrionaceae bacterium]|nr:ChaN family lipoprotein [Desulfurivibrionaceae bacterium]